MSEQAVILQRPNPFNYTQPAEAAVFVGHEEEQQRAVNILCESVPKICLVIGGPKVGKTSFIGRLTHSPNIHVYRIDCRDCDAATEPIEWLGQQITEALSDLLDRALAEIQARETLLVQERLEAMGEAIRRSLSAFQEEVQQKSESGQPISTDVAERVEQSLQSAKCALEAVLTLYPDEIGKEITTRRQLKDASEAVKQGLEALGSDYPEVRKEVEEILADLDGILKCLQDLWHENKSAAIAKARLSGYRSAISVQDFQFLGKNLQELHENIKLVLAFDDFDQLVENGTSDADQLTEVLRALRSLRGSSNFKIRLLQSLRDKPVKILYRKFPRQPEPLRIEIEAWTRDSVDIELTVMTQAEVKALIDNVGALFPQYVAREVFRETGGHPFLVQALCYFAFEERIAIERNPSVSDIVVWIEVMNRMKQSEHIKRFIQDLLANLSQAERALIQQVTRKGDELGRLPNEITWRGGLFRRQTGKAETSEIVNSLIREPYTRGLIFREADEDEIESAMPYLIRIDGEWPSTQYAIASRFIWRQLSEGVPKRSKPRRHLPELDVYQIPFFSLLLFMLPWFLFWWFGIDRRLAIPLVFLPSLYALIRWIIVRFRNIE